MTLLLNRSFEPSLRSGPDASGHCPECGSDLVIHQPDEALPDRLLGTCVDCKGWFLMQGEGRRPKLLVPAES